MRRTLATAGRTVLFSSLTVAGAIASLVVFPQRFLYSMGIGGFCVALIAAAIALIVLPAVLALLGERVNSLTPAFLARRAERDAAPDARGLLVPPLAARHALPRPHRRLHGGAADRARHPVPEHRLHLGRRPGAARVGARPPGRRRPARRLPALSRQPGHAGGRGRRGRRRPRIAREAAQVPGAAAVARPPATAAAASTRSTSCRPRHRSTSAARTWCSDLRDLDGDALVTGARPPATWTSRTASATTCRSCSRSSPS